MRKTHHMIKYPPNVQSLVLLVFLSSIQIYNGIRSWRREEFDEFFYTSWIFGILIFACILIALFRIFRKPFELQLNQGSLQILGRSVPADSIKMIMIRGVERPVIGIKPRGKWIVPLNRSFQFASNEELGTEAIANWAKTNNVELTYKSFVRWM